MNQQKPLGGKAYGSIPHLPTSRQGPGDHHCHEGQARIATEKVRDRHDRVIVQEKLDGSCTAVARIGDDIVAIGRAGWTAQSSPYEQHQLFADWVRQDEGRFRSLLQPGERAVGEWLAQAHGTRYDLVHEPWVLFDIMVGNHRAPAAAVETLAEAHGLMSPALLHVGPLPVEGGIEILGEWGFHGALDPVEGAVWRVERRGEVDFLVKWVRPDKVDGCYLPEVSGQPAHWNWRPAGEQV